MKISRAELVKLQRAIAEGRAPTPPSDGEFYWHPKIRLGLRLYNSGRGTWLVKYRNDRGLEKTYKIGDASVLNVSFAESAAKKVFGRVALEEDPVGDRQKQRARPKKTVGALCDEFLQEAAAGHTKTDYARSTLRGYANIAKLHLGVLRGMQADELDAQAAVNRIREIDKQTGSFNADRLRAMLSSVYNWAMTVYPKTIVLNPVTGTWRPNRPESTGQALSIEQLGAIWRACETLEAMAVPMCRNGHVAKPLRKLDGADHELIGIRKAASLTGLDHKTLRKAVRNGTLSRVTAIPKGARPGGASAHGPVPHYTTVGEVNRYLDLRPERSWRGELFGSAEHGTRSNGAVKDDLDDIICSNEGGDPQVLQDWRKMIRATSRQLKLNNRSQEVIEAVLKTAEGRALYERLIPKPWRARHGRQPGGANASVGGSSLAIGFVPTP